MPSRSKTGTRGRPRSTSPSGTGGRSNASLTTPNDHDGETAVYLTSEERVTLSKVATALFFLAPRDSKEEMSSRRLMNKLAGV
jgi:hypothetical protein